MTEPSLPRRDLDRLHRWLVTEAYDRWFAIGLDRVRGGCQEKIGQDGVSTRQIRRARVQTRQAYAFAQAPHLGWTGDAGSAVDHALSYFLEYFRRPDHLFRAAVGEDGSVADDNAVLYDQAFALLALAESQLVLDRKALLVNEGRVLRTAIAEVLGRAGRPGFYADLTRTAPLLANPHMHLFEACLAWSRISDDPEWRDLADQLGGLALSQMIDPESGMLREAFDEDWVPAAGLEGRIVEPGHQYEWAWLLLRWQERDPATREAAFRLIEIGETLGTRNGAAINALLDDGSVHDAAARLWPQTERLKATLRAAELTGEQRWWDAGGEAARCLQRYLETKLPGLWWDRLLPDGRFIDEPAPASSFYHIVAAIGEAVRVLESVRRDSRDERRSDSP